MGARFPSRFVLDQQLPPVALRGRVVWGEGTGHGRSQRLWALCGFPPSQRKIPARLQPHTEAACLVALPRFGPTLRGVMLAAQPLKVAFVVDASSTQWDDVIPLDCQSHDAFAFAVRA